MARSIRQPITTGTATFTDTDFSAARHIIGAAGSWGAATQVVVSFRPVNAANSFVFANLTQAEPWAERLIPPGTITATATNADVSTSLEITLSRA